MKTVVGLSVAVFFLWNLFGCGSTKESNRVTIAQIRALESFESLLPVGTDSVVELYRRNDPEQFHATYREQLEDAARYVDSLNAHLFVHSRIDTVAIDHTFDNFGTAACSGHTIFISSSYFLLYNNDSGVLHSVILHEFGHLIYQQLTAKQRKVIGDFWTQLGSAALLYLYREGEYSGNAKFGGHPYDSAAELFASAFNLLNSREREFAFRLQYVDRKHSSLIESFKRKVIEFSRVK